MTIEDIYASVDEFAQVFIEGDYVMVAEDGRVRTLCRVELLDSTLGIDYED